MQSMSVDLASEYVIECGADFAGEYVIECGVDFVLTPSISRAREYHAKGTPALIPQEINVFLDADSGRLSDQMIGAIYDIKRILGGRIVAGRTLL